jgi:hypothetical protein
MINNFRMVRENLNSIFGGTILKYSCTHTHKKKGFIEKNYKNI